MRCPSFASSLMTLANLPPGVFHDVNPPIHNHPSCDYCKKTSRCMGQDSSLKLSRCKECNITRYCSRECQMQGWKTGHKTECKRWKTLRDKAVALSGNPHAWTDFARWLEDFHDDISSAAMAYYMAVGAGSESNSVVYFTADYIADDELPTHRKFRFKSCDCMTLVPSKIREGLPEGYTIEPVEVLLELAAVRSAAVSQGAKQAVLDGKSPEHVGSYILEVSFGYDTEIVPMFPRLFQFTNRHLEAHPMPDPPELIKTILAQIFSRGREQKFCCGRVPELSTCCCGGWTHEEHEMVDEERYKEVADELKSQLRVSIVKGDGVPMDGVEEGEVSEKRDSDESKPKKTKKKKKVKRQEQSSIGLTPSTSANGNGVTEESAVVQPGSPRMAHVSAPSTTYASNPDPTSDGTSLIGLTTGGISASVDDRRASTQAASNDIIGSPDQERRRLPEPVNGNNNNEHVGVTLLSSPTNLNAELGKEHNEMDLISPRASQDQTESPDIIQSKAVNKKKPKRVKHQAGRASVVSESNGATDVYRSPTLMPASTTDQESLESVVAPIGAVEATGTNDSAGGRAVTPLMTRENPAGLRTVRPAHEPSVGDSVGKRSNDAHVHAEIDSKDETGQWVPVKSRKEKLRVKHNVPLPAESSTSFASSSQGGRDGGRGSAHVGSFPTRSASAVHSPRPAAHFAPKPKANDATMDQSKIILDPVFDSPVANSSTVSGIANPIREPEPIPAMVFSLAREPASPRKSTSVSIREAASAITSATGSTNSGRPPSITRRHSIHFGERSAVLSITPRSSALRELKYPGLIFDSLHLGDDASSLASMSIDHEFSAAGTQGLSESAPSGASATPTHRCERTTSGASGTTTPAAPASHPGNDERTMKSAVEVEPPEQTTMAKQPAPSILEEKPGTSGKQYKDGQEGTSELQHSRRAPHLPGPQQSLASNRVHRSKPHRQHSLQQQQGYYGRQPPATYYQQQQHGPAYHMYPPPGYLPQQAPWPYYNPYLPQAGTSQYVYGAPYNPYVGAYGIVPGPYGQPTYAHQAPTQVLANQDTAQAFSVAAEALKAAARMLEGATHDYRAAEEAHAAQSWIEGSPGVQ
ncbi:hypothetical protein PENSPDRAFT_740449 [Peniophora sp. CONT]|nr:hypothetical protein PENSPDRAFT_740449 [Peniophora sp. CONT]